ncbi:MAG TPA: TOBE domain-containing protein [Telluria sp.]|nr:TOBE domain-containing protein [Telluria sp.]
MKTSARNQFLGNVVAIQRGAINDEVELALASGKHLVAIVTHASVERLGLQPGVQAFAMVKASSVILVVDDDNVKFSARNRMGGIVTRLQTGAVNSEVVIDVDGGDTLVAIVTNPSCQSLDLAVGARAAGIFKASSVVLGVLA